MNIAKNYPKYDGYQHGLALMIYKLFNKNNSGGAVENETMSNEHLAEKLYKPIIKELKKRKINSPFKDKI